MKAVLVVGKGPLSVPWCFGLMLLFRKDYMPQDGSAAWLCGLSQLPAVFAWCNPWPAARSQGPLLLLLR